MIDCKLQPCVILTITNGTITRMTCEIGFKLARFLTFIATKKKSRHLDRVIKVSMFIKISKIRLIVIKVAYLFGANMRQSQTYLHFELLSCGPT